MEFVPEEGKQFHEECSILILPALSIGNVGQLAVDLLVSSMRAERVGYLDDPCVLPCVGNDAYGPVPQGELALPLEVEFAKNLADFAVTNGKKHIILLSSLDFGKWQNIDMSRS